MKKTKAIVTVAIGEEHINHWRTYCKPTWEAYARKHGYEIVVLYEPPAPAYVTENRTIHWQKCFILDHPEIRRFDDVVWLDTDVLINYHRAPCIVAANNSAKIGVVSLQQPTRRIFENTEARFSSYKTYTLQMLRDPQRREEYLNHCRQMKDSCTFGETLPENAINTGVMVLKPQLHRQFMRDIYFKYQEEAVADFEQGALSTELIKEGMCNYLDYGFNVIFYLEFVHHYPFIWNRGLLENKAVIGPLMKLCATTVFLNSYFLHFPGEKTHIPFVDTGVADEFVLPDFFAWNKKMAYSHMP